MVNTHKQAKKPLQNYTETLLKQGQPNLRAFVAHREDWELSKVVTNQPKIKWAINKFKPFKYAGTDGIVTALLQ